MNTNMITPKKMGKLTNLRFDQFCDPQPKHLRRYYKVIINIPNPSNNIDFFEKRDEDYIRNNFCFNYLDMTLEKSKPYKYGQIRIQNSHHSISCDRLDIKVLIDTENVGQRDFIMKYLDPNYEVSY